VWRVRFTVTSAFAAWLSAGVVWLGGGCATVDPGPQFVVPFENFNEDFFFCVVEPQYLVGKKCGSGDPGDSGRCHFNSSAVSGMALKDHPPTDCDSAGHPTNRVQVSTGSAARSNFTSASLDMSRDALTAPILVRPEGANHPRVILMRGDPVEDVIKQWANKP
jgi:hypothetical protein